MSKKDLLILIGTPSEIVAKLLDKFDREPFLVTLNMSILRKRILIPTDILLICLMVHWKICLLT